MRRLAILYTGLIICIIAMADAQGLPTILKLVREVPFFDKVCHFFLIGMLAFMVNLASDGRTWSIWGRRVFRGSVVVGVLITLEEFSQIMLPHRSFSWTDMAANLAGIVVFGALASRVLARSADLRTSHPAAVLAQTK